MKSNNSNGLALPNCTICTNSIKLSCNSAAASQNYLSGNSKYQLLINNNISNCARTAHLTFNNNNIINNKNYILQNTATEDNNENIINNNLNTSSTNSNNNNVNNEIGAKSNNTKQAIDTVDCSLINHHSNQNQTTNHHSFQSINHHLNPNSSLTSSSNHHHYFEQSATNQLINGLSGSCSQLNQLNNNFCTSNTNLISNHSISLSNLTNLSTTATATTVTTNKYNSNSLQQQPQCNCCLENNNNNLILIENRSWIPKFNSFGNDATEPVEILPHLLLGSELHASQLEMLKRIGVTALLNVSRSCPNHFEKDFVYKCIPVQDSSYEDISVYFDDAIQFIGKF